MSREYFVSKVIPLIIAEIGEEATITELNAVVRSMAYEYSVPNAHNLKLA